MAFLPRMFWPLFLYFGLLSCGAWARVELTMQESVEVYVGDATLIPCHFNFSHPMTHDTNVEWFVRDNSRETWVRLFHGNSTVQAVDKHTNYTERIAVAWDLQETRLTIYNVQISDERYFSCVVRRAEDAALDNTYVSVFAPPESLVIEGVLTGISVANALPSTVASCEVRNSFPKPNITWYKNNMQLMSSPGYVNVVNTETRESNGLYSVQSTLDYKVAKEDKDAKFSCKVNYSVPGAIGTLQSDSINVTVHYPTTTLVLWKESPLGLVKEGDTVVLRCQSDGNPPPSLTFTREEQDVELESNGHTLILSPVSRKDSSIYQCRPQADEQSNLKREMRLTVHYLDPAVVVLIKGSEVLLKGESLTATCNALSSLKTDPVWYKDGKQVGEGNTLHLQDATYETTGEYTCDVTVPSLPTLHTNSSVHVIVQGGPQLMGGDQDAQLEGTRGRMVNLSCEAQGYPPPSISWNIIGSQNWREVVSKSNEHMARSVVSVNVTSDISALCNVSNHMGTEVKAFSITAIPRVTSTGAFSSAKGSGVIIVVIILCLLLLASLGYVFHFLRKNRNIPCGRSGSLDITKETSTIDDIAVEMKTNPKPEDAALLKAVIRDKKGPNDQ